MNKIDTSEWKEYKLSELFEIKLSHDDLQPQKLSEGGVPLVSSGKNNNGIVMNIPCDERYELFPANSITVDMFGKVFYQAKPYYAVSHGRVNILVPKYKNNEVIGNAISIILESSLKGKYSFDKMCSQKALKNETILLPSKKEYEPDWDYMESYMKKVMKEMEDYVNKMGGHSVENHSVDVSRWGEFRVGDLFHMEKQIELNPVYVYTNSTENETFYPFYGQSSENNGIIDYYYLGENLLNNKGAQFCIMIHSNTHLAYCVNTPFYLKDGHGATTIFTNKNLNDMTTYFLISVLNTTMNGNFDYDTKATKERLNDLIVKLPITSAGEPDWQYMENYMKRIMNEEKQSITNLQI